MLSFFNTLGTVSTTEKYFINMQSIGHVNKSATPGASGYSDQFIPLLLFEGATYWYLFYLGEGDGIGNINRTFLVKKPKTENVHELWTDFEGGVDTPTDILPLTTAGLWDSKNNFISTIIEETPGNYVTWYSANSSTNSEYKIGRATSTDLINWTKSVNPVYEDLYFTGGVLLPQVIIDGGIYHMLLMGVGGDYDGRLNTAYATSPDGVVWTTQNNSLVPFSSYAGPLKKEGSTFTWLSSKTTSGPYPCDPLNPATLSSGNVMDKYIVKYYTTDWINVREEIISEYDWDMVEGLRAPSSHIETNFDGSKFIICGYYKYQIQFGREEVPGCLTLRNDIAGVKHGDVMYPSYITNIYNINEGAKDLITLNEPTRTGAINNRTFKTNYFGPGQYLEYSSYDIDKDYFAVKTKIYWKVADTVNDHHYVNIFSTSAASDYIFSLSNLGPNHLTITVKSQDGTKTKSYNSVQDLVNYLPVVGNPYFIIDIGFIWNAGTLQLCAGFDTDVPVVKNIDDVFTEIGTTSNESLRIGALDGSADGMNTDIYPVILISGEGSPITNKIWNGIDII